MQNVINCKIVSFHILFMGMKSVTFDSVFFEAFIYMLNKLGNLEKFNYYKLIFVN